MKEEKWITVVLICQLSVTVTKIYETVNLEGKACFRALDHSHSVPFVLDWWYCSGVDIPLCVSGLSLSQS